MIRRHSRNTRSTIDELQSAARGRWKDILADVGFPAELLNGKGHPCPRCGGRDRFAAWRDVGDRGAVHCRHCFTKGSNPRPGDGLATLRWMLNIDTPGACRWLASWLGLATPTATPRKRINRTLRPTADADDDQSFGVLADRCHRAMRDEWWDRLSNRLRLPAITLRRLRVGWCAAQRATTWPMVDHSDRVIGIRLRSMTTGDKWAIRGGRAGLFVPEELRGKPDRLFIAEGPTDTAALLSLGVDAVGRLSCNGAVGATTKLVKRLGPSECIVVADDDGHRAGIRGAESLASVLVTACPSVRVIVPPKGFNDVREWVTAGAKLDDLIAITDLASVRSLSIAWEVNHG